MKNQHRISALLLLLLSVFVGCAGGTGSAEPDMMSFLPGSGDVPGWSTSGEPLEYAGDDLWNLINGGAEIYHEYGFERVIAQEYTDEAGHSVSVELYKMSSPAAAYGIFTFKSGNEGEVLPLTHNGLLEDYYLNFWKGRYLVTITGFDADNATVEGLKAIASHIDGLITAVGTEPDLAGYLPKDGLQELSIKYFLGNLGLFNSYAFATADVFGFTEAVKADYDGGYQVYILRMNDSSESNERFEGISEVFSNSEKYSNFSANGNLLRMEDRDGRKISIKKSESAVLIIIGNNENAETVLNTIVF